MESGADSTVDVKMAYRRDPGQKLLDRLTHPERIRVQLLRARLTQRHARLLLRLQGESLTIDETIRDYSTRSIAVRVLSRL